MPMEWSADEQQYRQAFESIARQAIDAVMFNGFGPNYRNRFLIAELAKAHRLPSICWFVDVAKAEGFLAYASDTADLLDRFARQIDQALKGVNVANIPAYQPTKFIIAVNLRTARSLGLQIPASLVAQADEVIE
jgi:putative ABC transport system substrate-binding protein